MYFQPNKTRKKRENEEKRGKRRVREKEKVAEKRGEVRRFKASRRIESGSMPSPAYLWSPRTTLSTLKPKQKQCPPWSQTEGQDIPVRR